MDLVLNILRRLIRHKTQPTNYKDGFDIKLPMKVDMSLKMPRRAPRFNNMLTEGNELKISPKNFIYKRERDQLGDSFLKIRQTHNSGTNLTDRIRIHYSYTMMVLNKRV